MLNEDYILKIITPRLNSARAISEHQYFELFARLSKKEHYEVIGLLIKHNIEIEYDDVQNTDMSDASQTLPVPQEDGTDYKNLLNLSNEILAKMGQEGDRSAIAALIVKNEKFIYKIIQKESKKYARTCMTEDDLFQEGCLGVYKAVEKFDADLGFSFLTYCGHWVRQAISRSVIDKGFLVRIPVHMFDKIRKVQYYRRSFPMLSQSELVDHIIEAENNAERIMTENDIKTCLVLSEQYLNMTSINSLVGEDQSTELVNPQ